MVETLSEDYIRTAQAKGVRPAKVLFKHALRAAIVPVITIFGLDFATLLAGTIFIEQIFSIDGIGHWGLQALTDPDRHQRRSAPRCWSARSWSWSPTCSSTSSTASSTRASRSPDPSRALIGSHESNSPSSTTDISP